MRRQAAEGLERRLATVVWQPDMDAGGARGGRSALSRAAGLRARRHRPDEVPGLFPDRLRLHQVGQGATACRSGRGAARAPARSSPGAWTITDLDPLRFGLLFERFLNPDRVSMPDFDIDFCEDRRDEVIAYVRDRYGADRVAQIITFGTLQARAALRDVGRVLGPAVRAGRPDLQAGAAQSGQPGDAGPGDRARAAAEGGARRRSERGPDDRHRAPARRPAAQCLDPCRRRGDRRPAAGRAGAALPRPARADAVDPVQHEGRREGGAGQVRLSGPVDAHHARAGRAAGERARRPTEPGGAAARRSGRPTSCSPAPRRRACSSWNPPACATRCASSSPTASRTSWP